MNKSQKSEIEQPEFRCIQDIFSAVGTATKLAAELGLHGSTVEAWRRSGIPIKYWSTIQRLTGISLGALYNISLMCRQSVTNPSRVKP